MKAPLLSLAIITLLQSAGIAQDSSLHYRKSSLKDTLKSLSDTIIKSGRQLLDFKKDELKQKGKGLSLFSKNTPKLKHLFGKDSTRFSIPENPFKDLLSTSPAFGVNGGYISYQFTYRSNIDTPFVEKEVGQHNLTGGLNFILAGNLPFSFNYWVRRSNSSLFRDITDVQFSFDAGEFGKRMKAAAQSKLLNMARHLRDSLSEQLLALKGNKLKEVEQWLNHPMQLQSLIECNEILNVPRITFDPSLPDSVNRKRTDSLQQFARLFLDLYKRTQGEMERIQGQVDSLKKIVETSLARVKHFKEMIQGGGFSTGSMQEWKNKMQEFGLSQIRIPAKYRWLMGIRRFSLGRSLVNYSDLTAKNISVNGINFEYNSWYYFALTAGMVDYRFRDFITNPLRKAPLYLFLARVGIGRLEGNHFIATVYRGQKQLFASSSTGTGMSAINITGLTFETKWRIYKTNWISAEVSESFSPDLRNNPPVPNSKFDLSDETNKAWAIRIYSWQPRTNSRLEAMYKYMGANYQSFSSFQTSAGQKAWFIKAEQAFWKRQIRINASLRSNDYFNPFIQQQYSSNTIFKSITATLRRRKWPVVTIGYQPMSQLTKLDNQILENRFQTLTASVYYLYKLNNRQSATTIVYNQFYNTSADTGFIYFNAINLYAYQNFFFKHFNANAGFSYTRNANYQLVLLDGSVQKNFTRLGHIGFGIKINNHNKSLNKIGGYLQAGIKITRFDILSLHVERGWLPGFSKGLVQNDLGNIQFTKTFRFR